MNYTNQQHVPLLFIQKSNSSTGIVYPTTHVIQEGPKIFHITSGTYKQPWRTWGIRGEDDLLLFGQQIEGEHRNKREVMWMCYVDCCLFEPYNKYLGLGSIFKCGLNSR